MSNSFVKKFCILSLLVLMFFNVACGNTKIDDLESVSTETRFITIEDTFLYRVVYDKYTKVMYTISDGDYNHGAFSVLYDSDGSVLLYEEK